MKTGKKAHRVRAASRAAAASRRPKPASRLARGAAHEVAKRLSPVERRAQLLRLVEELFTQRPYAQITILDVARAANVTQGLVYHYFESKEALFEAAVEASAAELLRACMSDRALPIPRQFELGLQGYLDHVEVHRIAYLNLFRGPAAVEPTFKAIADRTRQAIVDYIVDGMGLSNRHIPATRLSLRGYVGYVENAILEWLEHPGVPRSVLERMIFAVVITALRMGLASDKDVPLSPAQWLDFELAYKRHFGLP
jgi:AcrR family transcriptional regulator